jgi:hypothetical protein
MLPRSQSNLLIEAESQKEKDRESIADDGVIWRTTKSGHTIGIDPKSGKATKGNPKVTKGGKGGGGGLTKDDHAAAYKAGMEVEGITLSNSAGIADAMTGGGYDVREHLKKLRAVVEKHGGRQDLHKKLTDHISEFNKMADLQYGNVTKESFVNIARKFLKEKTVPLMKHVQQELAKTESLARSFAGHNHLHRLVEAREDAMNQDTMTEARKLAGMRPVLPSLEEATQIYKIKGLTAKSMSNPSKVMRAVYEALPRWLKHKQPHGQVYMAHNDDVVIGTFRLTGQWHRDGSITTMLKRGGKVVSYAKRTTPEEALREYQSYLNTAINNYEASQFSGSDVEKAKFYAPGRGVMQRVGRTVTKAPIESVDEKELGRPESVEDLTEAKTYKKGQMVDLRLGHPPKIETYKVLRYYPTKADAEGPFPTTLTRLIRKGGGALLVELQPGKKSMEKDGGIHTPGPRGGSWRPKEYIVYLDSEGNVDGAPVYLKPHQFKRVMSYKESVEGEDNMQEALGVPDLNKWKITQKGGKTFYTIKLHGKTVTVSEKGEPARSGLYRYRIFIDGKRYQKQDETEIKGVMRTVQTAVMEDMDEAMARGVTSYDVPPVGPPYPGHDNPTSTTRHPKMSDREILMFLKSAKRLMKGLTGKQKKGYEREYANLRWEAQRRGLKVEGVEPVEESLSTPQTRKHGIDYKLYDMIRRSPGIVNGDLIKMALKKIKVPGFDKDDVLDFVDRYSKAGFIGAKGYGWKVTAKGERVRKGGEDEGMDEAAPKMLAKLGEPVKVVKFGVVKIYVYHAPKAQVGGKYATVIQGKSGGELPGSSGKTPEEAIAKTKALMKRTSGRTEHADGPVADGKVIVTESVQRFRMLAGIAPLPRPLTEMRKKSLRKWIRANRAEIDAAIKNAVPNIRKLNDSDREDWVMNDEGLYNWARSEGVNV